MELANCDLFSFSSVLEFRIGLYQRARGHINAQEVDVVDLPYPFSMLNNYQLHPKAPQSALPLNAVQSVVCYLAAIKGTPLSLPSYVKAPRPMNYEV